ncbi:Hpt domain-containing protein [Pseudaminobacter sp. 19-2017]|uniref:Hpt domain-containing protein n=2 Tax=Pseudaminobacter soli (ex Zhang et al. 2022) TaxID=2831468 RepID=A0A942I9N3_9HYPH|nr:Hpt domain-containing protein [Pseudaminobacter soli]MBS3649566.1 Hpt domain-containing protein [Pseudaminobacter soli]
MLHNKANAVAFSMPGGESSGVTRSRPIDLAHLSRQTMGDRGVEEEVLGLFLQQTQQVRERIAQSTPAERRLLAHQLLGSARGVGAFAIADCAAEIERQPDNLQAQRRLEVLIDEARDFVAGMCR